MTPAYATMKKLSFALGAIILLVLLILPNVVALTTARAGMAQAQANAAQATANTVQSVATMVSQCLAGLMVFIALIGGLVIGYGFHAWRFILQKIPAHTLRREVRRKWLPGPNARWGRSTNTQATQPASPDLPHALLNTFPSPAPTPPPHTLTMADLDGNSEDVESLIGSQWGF
jgi:hypothetical protein